MIFDDEERDSKFMEAMRLLVDCVEDNADYLLLIAMIRMFHEVKHEKQQDSARRRKVLKFSKGGNTYGK